MKIKIQKCVEPRCKRRDCPWNEYSISGQVKVTAADIKKGKRGRAKCCPIALAVRRALPHATYVTVTSAVRFRLRPGRDDFSAELPKKAFNFIDRFDVGKKVKPFNFHLKTKA